MPSQLALRQISPELRALLWQVLYTEFLQNRTVRNNKWRLGGWPNAVMIEYWVRHLHKMVDDYDDLFPSSVNFAKQIVSSGNYAEVLGFVEFIIRQEECPVDVIDQFSTAFVDARAAYRIADYDTVIPIQSDEIADTVERAFHELGDKQLSGAKTHLKSAASAIAVGSWSAGIRESVHAVEAVARKLEPSATTLDPALAKLERAGHIHSALRQGFGKLYGFSNDEQGIRHALLDKPEADVDEVDALYMFGACAAFVSYLIAKARAGGLLAV